MQYVKNHTDFSQESRISQERRAAHPCPPSHPWQWGYLWPCTMQKKKFNVSNLFVSFWQHAGVGQVPCSGYSTWWWMTVERLPNHLTLTHHALLQLQPADQGLGGPVQDKIVIVPNNGTWWTLWRRVDGGDDLRRGRWLDLGDWEHTWLIVPTVRHGIAR